MTAGTSEPRRTRLAAAAHAGAREVFTDDPVLSGNVLAAGSGGNPARGERVLPMAPGRRSAGDDLVARLAASRHGNYPAGTLISDLNYPEVFRCPGFLVLV
jgi:hypothetical protein